MMEQTKVGREAVETPYGTLVGTQLDGVTRFARVRYAKPPIGQRRFRLPEPVQPWSEPLDCTCEGTIPPQLPSRLARVMGDYPAVQDEDCLHLDIWVPKKRAAGTPIFVFVHGGAFMTGGGSLSCYDGAILATSGELIVVNISYRLGALGFLPVNGVAPANLGLHDQVAALRFLREIAPAFGGDAGNITIAGQSAGALSIALLLASPAQNTLFKRSIIMSAPLGLDLPTVEASERIGRDFMKALGLAPNDRKGLEEQPIERLMNAQLEIAKVNIPPLGEVTVPYVPAIDGELILTHPRNALEAGAAAGHEMLIGTTREEMTSFYLGNQDLAKAADNIAIAAFHRRYGENAEEAIQQARAKRIPGKGLPVLCDLMTGSLFADGSHAVARAQLQNGRSPFVYRFDWQSPAAEIQACHCIELPFLFGNLDTWRIAPMLAEADLDEVAGLGRKFRGALAAFAKSGKPDGADLPAWPEYGTQEVIQHFDNLIEARRAA